MNIFKVLANGYGNINENNISAFLGYLLDPRGDHGLNDEFLKLFLRPLGDKYFNDHKTISFNNLSVNSDYLVEIFFEKEFYPKVKRSDNNTEEQIDPKQRIDIIIKISKKPPESNEGEVIFLAPKPFLLILVENKIRDNAFTKEQLIKQQSGLKGHLKKIMESSINDKEKFSGNLSFEKLIDECYSIYVTTDTNNYAESFKGAINEEDEERRIKGVHWCWNIKNDEDDDSDNIERGKYDGTIIEIITELFSKESEGSIEPMNDITKHTLKAFKNFIAIGFKSKLEEARSSSMEFYDSLDEAIAKGGGHFSTMPGNMQEWIRELDEEIQKNKDGSKPFYTKNLIRINFNGRKIWHIEFANKGAFKIKYFHTSRGQKENDPQGGTPKRPFYMRENLKATDPNSKKEALNILKFTMDYQNNLED